MPTSLEIRSSLISKLRRDLIGPLPAHVEPSDADLATERLDSPPSRWYLAGFIAPKGDAYAMGAKEPATEELIAQEETDISTDQELGEGAGGAAGDTDQPDAPNTTRRFLPSSIGITVLLPAHVKEIKARLTWGDYVTEPLLPEFVLTGELPPDSLDQGEGKEGKPKKQPVTWLRSPRDRMVTVPVPEGRGAEIIVPESAAAQRRGGGLVLESHARSFTLEQPDGSKNVVRALTVFLVNKRKEVDRAYADVCYAFQARIELICEGGFYPKQDLSGLKSVDSDHRTADLHYREVCDYAVGRNVAAGWDKAAAATGRVSHVWTDPLPQAEVERVAPNEDHALKAAVLFGMEDLAEAAMSASDLVKALDQLPVLYEHWIDQERVKASTLPKLRAQTAAELITAMEAAKDRIAQGIAALGRDQYARLAFRFMNEAVARAARRRNAGPQGDPAAQRQPTWRPFQLAFILLNLSGLADRTHPDRELADLLFFPTGGGKTEAYLGLAAFVIAHRRLTGSGVLGAGVAVIMRYTLRLLTLDQLARAAGVVCALELMRTDPANKDEKGRNILGDWPIEIGLWVGSDASPNALGGRGNTGDHTAVTRVRRYARGQDKRAPAPIKGCPWCGAAFTPKSFACVPDNNAPRNLEITCANPTCDFTRDRPLPIITVDDAIYRRLPAFLIATMDKFASLPWEGRAGAFFGHVDRFDPVEGFFGASEAGGRPLGDNWRLDPPDLIIQDELHLISGPLGTVAGLYEAAIDLLASRTSGERKIRPKIVASTATVRRAQAQIKALFDRDQTAIFPPPGIDRTDSFYARTVPTSIDPARQYVGIAAQGRGPKLVFLRALTTLLAAAKAEFEEAKVAMEAAGVSGPNPADPYMTAVCYFNALKELGGARRIVEDEVRDRASRYGTERKRLDPTDRPFHNRDIREPMELTSRVSTDKVAQAKRVLEEAFGGAGETIDVALATNMISVGLDIVRLGLMVVQGQPKTAAEYIQATSRVGRDHNRPGLVLAVLNLHKPRDRMHFEQFGSFHETFYRAVEATSVTPWAARALDRALAATVVAAIRHLDPSLTPEDAAVNLKDRPALQQLVRQYFIDRAPPAGISGGSTALAAQIDRIIAAWLQTADVQTGGGTQFRYAKSRSPQRLLHQPLEPGFENLSHEHQLFVAGRSMRDVEASVHLNVRGPNGQLITNADDL